MFMLIHDRSVAIRAAALVVIVVIAAISWLFLKINFWLASTFFVFFGGVAVWMWNAASTVTSKPLPDATKWAEPNAVPLRTRLFNTLVSVFLVVYTCYSVVNDDFYLPAKRGPGIHLHGFPVWIFALTCLTLVTNLMSKVVDHYDRRNNELIYAHIDAATKWLGWIFFLFGVSSSFVLHSNN